jgi:hypothetical protein
MALYIFMPDKPSNVAFKLIGINPFVGDAYFSYFD